MNNESVKVSVTWMPEKVHRLPTSSSYSTVAKFVEDAESWPDRAWSVVLEFEPAEGMRKTFDARARFLVSDAPWKRLQTGCTFEMYEGLKLTAKVKVL